MPKEGGWHLLPLYSVMWASASSRNWEQCFLFPRPQTTHQPVNKQRCQSSYSVSRTNAFSSKLWTSLLEQLFTYFQTPTFWGYWPSSNLGQLAVASEHVPDIWKAGLTLKMTPSIWIRYVDCALLSCVGGDPGARLQTSWFQMAWVNLHTLWRYSREYITSCQDDNSVEV